LTQSIAVAGGVLRRGATATTLTGNPDGTYRVGYSDGKCEHALHARAVIIADGGFHADPQKMAAFVSPDPTRVLQRNARTAMGLGIELARNLGARLSRLDRFYGHVQSIDALQNPRLWPYPTVDDLASAGITVGHDAKRFFDEGKGGVYAANAIASSQNPTAYVIFDQPVWDGVGRNTRIVPCNPFLEEAGGTLYSADTIERLAQASGLNPMILAETVRRYNAGEFQVMRSSGKFGHRPIVSPPFFCIPACAAITYTMGGLCVDSDAAILSQDGRPLAGLYAAGSTVGDTEGGNDVFYLGGLMKAAVLGCIAGESASRHCRRNARLDQVSSEA
jgi:fumarate reductase flavoprotein subunit